MATPDRSLVLHLGEGKAISAIGIPLTFKAVGLDTGGAYSLLEFSITGEGPPPHVHKNEDEAWYVVEGELTVLLGERTVKAPAGSFIFAPRGLVHRFWNEAAEPARVLALISPAGLEKMFEELGESVPAAPRPSDIEEIVRLHQLYDIETVMPSGV